MRARMKDLVSEYGPIALTVYLTTTLIVGVPAFALISAGIEIEGVKKGASTLFATWVVIKLSQPVRIAVTVALTPFVARLVRPDPDSAEEEGQEGDAQDLDAVPAPEVEGGAPSEPVESEPVEGEPAADAPESSEDEPVEGAAA